MANVMMLIGLWNIPRLDKPKYAIQQTMNRYRESYLLALPLDIGLLAYVLLTLAIGL